VEARKVLDDLERSGLPASRFAARQGLGLERLYRWKRRLGRGAKPALKTPAFTEVALRTSGGAAIELVLPGGIVARFSGASRLEDTVAVLSHLASR
jgi:hypothetical protein